MMSPQNLPGGGYSLSVASSEETEAEVGGTEVDLNEEDVDSKTEDDSTPVDSDSTDNPEDSEYSENSEDLEYSLSVASSEETEAEVGETEVDLNEEDVDSKTEDDSTPVDSDSTDSPEDSEYSESSKDLEDTGFEEEDNVSASETNNEMENVVTSESTTENASDTQGTSKATSLETEVQEREPAESDPADLVFTEQSLIVETDDVTITISGLLPENATVAAEPVDVKIEGKNVLLAFDISIFYLDEDGSEAVYEPEDGTITVTIESAAITGGSDVYYVPEDGEPEKLDTVEAEDGAVEFEAEHFSTYAVVSDTESGDEEEEEEGRTVVETGDCSAAGDGSVTWTVYSDGTLVIDGEGSMCDYASANDEPWQTYLGKNGDPIVTTLEIGSGITYIGAYAFVGVNNENFPNTITTIIFGEESSLTEIRACAFYDCEGLTNVVLPDSVTTIGDYAFYQCDKLVSVDLPENLETIGSYAFAYCSALTEVTIPAGVTTISDNAFRSCVKLTTVAFEDGSELTTIGDSAFNYCYQLNSIELPDLLTSIGNSAFACCYAMSSITIPASVETIGFSAFNMTYTYQDVEYHYSSSLRAVTFEDGSKLTAISDSTFEGCSSLTSVNIPGTVTSIGSKAFYYCTSLANIDLPASLESLGSYAFYNCVGLTKIDIPDGVTAIEEYTFYGCTSLAAVTLPGGLTSIGDYAFYHADGLTTITIPADVISIGEYAFYDSGLIGVTFLNTIGIDMGVYTFARSSELASVNEETTLSGAMTLLDVTDSSIFYQTALTDDNACVITQDAIIITDVDGDGNEIVMTINQTKNADGEVDSEYLTGEYAFTTVQFESICADLANKTARIYIQFDNDNGAIRSSDGAGTTTTWSAGDTITFTSDGMTFDVTLYQAGNVEGFYYLELSDLDAGSTIEFTFVTYYPSTPTEGGSAVIYGEIADTDSVNADGTPSGSAYTAHQITWSTEPEEYTVEKKTSGSAGFDYDEDEDAVFLTGLKYTITVNRTSNHTSYGKDYVETAVFTDVLSLPEGLTLRDGLAEAIAAGNWYVTSGKEVHVIVNSVDYVLCQLSGGPASLSTYSLSVSSLTTDNDGDIMMTWTMRQEKETYNISPSAMTITYGDNVIEYTGSKTLSDSSVSFRIPNTVEAEFTFNYSSEIQTSQSTATAYAALSNGTLIVYMNDYYKGVSSSVNSYYMGSAYHYWIDLENDEALPYYDLRYIEDTLCAWLYLEPDEMESLLNDDHALSITINNATLYETISDEVTSTDGSLVIIDQQMEGAGTSYGDNVTSYGTAAVLSSEDTVKADNVTITLSWDDTNNQIKIEVTDGYNYTGTYSSVSEALNAIGYFVTNDVTYTLLWDLGDDYVLTGNTKIELVRYYAVVKDTFMRISGDLYWNLLQNDDAFSNDDVLLETLVTNYVAAYGDDYGSGNVAVLDSDSVIKGNIYRDFALVKGYTVSRDNLVLEDGASITDGDIIDYYVDVKHEGTGSYSGLPLVDKMSAGQTLLVPAESNTALVSYGLETETVDGVGYYRLTTGIYEDVFINSDTIADKIEVNEDGTFIYCYIKVSGTGITEIRYKAIVDTQELSGMDFSVCNEVWLNDHETHRLYDVTTIGGSKLTIDKLIVTKKGTAPSGDETTRRTVLSEAGTQVTYRLALENNSACEVTVTGADVYDELPFSISDNPWTSDDITISIVTDDANVAGMSATDWETGWAVQYDNPGTDTVEDAAAQCYLVWDDDLTLTFTGTVYFYMTLTYPEADELWDIYVDAYKSANLVNTFHVFALESEVSHGIVVETKASLYKGVLESGLVSASSQTSVLSSVTYVAATDEDGLWYYTNDSAGRYGYVEYYVVLYNEGPVNLYLNTLEDVLPDGFTYNANTTKKPTAATDMTVTDSQGNEVICKTFDVTATYDSDANIVSFDLSGGELGYSDDYERYYLEPGEAAVFTYYVWTNAYADSSDAETNSIAMPFYDYSGGGLALSNEVSGDTVSWDTEYNRNDGNTDIWNAAEAALYGMTGEGNDWLASSVTVYREQIKPGIEKTTDSDTAGSGETLTWSVKVTNDGESTMTGYYVYDVIQSPYFFTGDLTYTVYDSAGNSTTYTIGTLSGSEGVCHISGYKNNTGSTKVDKDLSADSWTYVYAYTTKTSTSAKYVVGLRAWIDSNGNLVLCINLGQVTVTDATIEARTKRAFALPSGGYGVLSIDTTSDSSTYYNGVITNTAYVRPAQGFHDGYIGNGAEVLATDGDEIVGTHHAVMDEASVAVSYGYSTTSSKSVTELYNDRTETDNTATSTSKDTSIALTSAESTFRYTLKVTNGNEKMDELILLDNLPKEGDTMTLTAAERKSEFTVLLADIPNFTVAVTESNGTITALTEGDDYKIQYSTSDDVGEDDLDVDSSVTTNTWYDALSEIPVGETVHSFRIIFLFHGDNEGDYEAGDYIPAYAAVTVTFDTMVDNSTADTGEIAYNSFGYLYSASTSSYELTASPRRVGVQIPTAPSLVKELVESDGSTAASAEVDTEFTFLIYEGTTTITGENESELLAALYADGITTLTKVTVTVKQGEAASDSLLLADLKKYTITENNGTCSVEESSYKWTWTDDVQYTIIEIPNSEYDFHSWNTTTKTNGYTFTYDSAGNITLTCVNQEQAWTLTLYKVDENVQTKVLAGAIFALYSPVSTDQMSESDYAALMLDTKPAQIKITDAGTANEKIWYLYDVQITDDNGMISWSNLKKEEAYYLMEVQAPDGYSLTYSPEVVSQTSTNVNVNSDKTAAVISVTNAPSYDLPESGGIGTGIFILTGLLLCGGAAVLLRRRYYRQLL